MSNTAQITSQIVDVRLQGLLKALRLPTVAQHYQSLARQALEQGQGYPEYLVKKAEFTLCKVKRVVRDARPLFKVSCVRLCPDSVQDQVPSRPFER